jgi:hypothetical protein
MYVVYIVWMSTCIYMHARAIFGIVSTIVEKINALIHYVCARERARVCVRERANMLHLFPNCLCVRTDVYKHPDCVRTNVCKEPHVNVCKDPHVTKV